MVVYDLILIVIQEKTKDEKITNRVKLQDVGSLLRLFGTWHKDCFIKVWQGWALRFRDT